MTRTLRASVLGLLAGMALAVAAPATANAAPDWGCTATPLTASLLGAELPLDLLRSNPSEVPCANDQATILDIPPVVGLTATVLDSDTDVTAGPIAGRTATAHARVADLGLSAVGFANVLTVGVADARVAASCVDGSPVFSATSMFDDVRVLGTQVDLLNGPVDINLGLVRAQITPNYEERTATGVRRVALHVRITALLGGAEVLVADVADASVDAVDLPCSATGGEPPTVTVAPGTGNREVTAQTTPASGAAHDAVTSCTISARPQGSSGSFIAVPTTFNAATGACTAKLDAATFPGPGQYEVRASAVDGDGDEGLSDPATVTVQVPAVDSPTANGRVLTADVTPVPGVAIDSCEFELTPPGRTVAGTYDAGTQTCSATMPGDLPDGSYDVEVTVVDVNGDRGSAQSSGVEVTGNAPTVVLEPGQPNRAILATGTAPEGETLESCTIEVRSAGGGTFAEVESEFDPDTRECTAQLGSDTHPAGEYEVRVTVVDSSGDSGQTTGTLTILAPSVDPPALTGRTLTADVTPVPGVAIDSCEFELTPPPGGGPGQTLEGTYDAGSETCSVTVPDEVRDGAYDVEVTVVDVNGDTGTAQATELVLRGNAPTVALEPGQPNREVVGVGTPPAGEVLVSCTVQVRPAGNGAFQTVDSTFDAASGECSAKLERGTYPPGDYDVRVTVVDGTGDSGQTDGTITIVTPTVGTPSLEDRTIETPVTPAPGVPLTDCEVTITPPGVVVDGTISGGVCRAELPPSVGPGPKTVDVVVTDENGDTGEGSGEITVPISAAPTVTLQPGQPNREVVGIGTPPAGEELVSCTIEVRPASGGAFAAVDSTFDAQTGRCSAKLDRETYPPGDYVVRVTVVDDTGDSGQTTGTVTVQQPTVGDPVLRDRTIEVPITPAPGVPITSCRITVTPAGGGAPVVLEGVIAGGVCRAQLPPEVGPGPKTVDVVVTDANGDTGNGSGGITVPTPNLPGAGGGGGGNGSPFSNGSPSDLALACTDRRLVLTDVVRIGRRVRVSGATEDAFRGRRVDVVLATTGKVVARPLVAADGLVRASVRAPRGSVAKRARYVLRSGRDTSLPLKLARRMARVSLTRSGNTVTFRGSVTRPLARKPQTVLLRRMVSCGRFETVGRTRLGRGGTYRFRIPAPTDARTAVYRAETRVPSRPGGPARNATFTLPQAIALR